MRQIWVGDLACEVVPWGGVENFNASFRRTKPQSLKPSLRGMSEMPATPAYTWGLADTPLELELQGSGVEPSRR